MSSPSGPGSPRSAFLTLGLVVAMVAVPTALTLARVRVPSVTNISSPNPSPLGYTTSLLLFLIPIAVILIWLVPRDDVKISRRSFLISLAILVPAGCALDFFFAHLFFRFPNPQATLQIPAPALGDTGSGTIFLGSPGHVIVGSVPVEEYIFYLTGFITILLLYIWLDEYWLAAYSVPVTAHARITFDRLLRIHPWSLVIGIVLIAAAILYRHIVVPQLPGFPGYFTFLVAIALGPSTILFPSALPVINWRALSLALFLIVLISLLWEVTLAIPYGWWGFQPGQMIGVFITAWDFLPLEEVCVWIAVTYQTVIVYEVVRRWQSSGKTARQAFLGNALYMR
jgi:hypothetical protein